MEIPKIIINKQEKIALAIIAVFVLLFFKPVISGDGFGYYVILEGGVRDHSLNLSSQVHYNDITHGPTVWFNQATQKYVSQYAPGLPLLGAPFYAASLVLDDFSIFHVKDDFFLEERGDILIHQMAVALTTLAMVLIGIIATFAVLRKLGLEKFAAAAALVAFFGSPLVRYATYDLSYTHGAEAGLMALVLLAFFVWERPLAVGALLGLMTLVRFTSAAFVLPFLAYYYFAGKKEKIKVFGVLKGFLPFILLLMAYFTVQYGGPFSTGYSQGSDLGDNFDILPLHALTVLFSLDRNPPGLLFWSPALVLACMALVKWKDERKWVLLGIALLLLWTTGSFFQGTTGYSFSHRYFAAMFPVMALGAAVLLREAKKGNKKYKYLLYGFTVYSLLLFLLSLAASDKLAGTPPSLPEIISYWFFEGHLGELPAAIISKLGFVRLLVGK